MDKQFYKDCIKKEVYEDEILPLYSKIWYKHFRTRSNAVYLIRKMQFVGQKGVFLSSLRRRCLEVFLMRRYGIFVDYLSNIGLGLRIAHPSSIMIARTTIGENCYIHQNCTVGERRYMEWENNLLPKIGNNVTLCTGSIVLGDINIADNVTIGANSCLIHDALESGTYVGSPAKRVK